MDCLFAVKTDCGCAIFVRPAHRRFLNNVERPNHVRVLEMIVMGMKKRVKQEVVSVKLSPTR